jgi:hypothetical protein
LIYELEDRNALLPKIVPSFTRGLMLLLFDNPMYEICAHYSFIVCFLEAPHIRGENILKYFLSNSKLFKMYAYNQF